MSASSSASENSHHQAGHEASGSGAGHGGHGGHGAPGGEHVPHVLPLKVYFGTWAALMVLTAITVGASYVDFGAGNIVIALVVATLKAGTVAALFMHLWFDYKFHTVILLSSLIFLGIFIAFTMFDTDARGRTEIIEADRPTAVDAPFKGSHADEAIKAAANEYYLGQKPAPAHPEGEHGAHPAGAEPAPGHEK